MFMWMCIVSEMVWCTSFFCLGAGDAQKNNSFCVHTKFLWGGNVLTIMGFQSIMMAGELGGNIG